MPIKINIIKNPMDLGSFETYEAEDLCAFLVEHFDNVWPETARIYHAVLAQEYDVTPECEHSIARLIKLTEDEEEVQTYWVVVYPGKKAVKAVVNVVSKVVKAVVNFFTGAFAIPKVPTPTFTAPAAGLSNRQNNSPNNELSQRTNRERINGRIPDIFGSVRSTPDLIAVPYRVYENNQEIEIAYMCIGRGAYDVSSVKDGDTLLSEISGSTVEIYAPFTSPNSGASPQLRIGSAITEDVIKAREITGVNGQTLRAPNSDSVSGNANIRFIYPDTVEINSSLDFTDFFAADDSLTISNSSFSVAVEGNLVEDIAVKFTLAGEIVFQIGDPSEDYAAGDVIILSNTSRTDGSHPINLDGTYTIDTVDGTKITLVDPAAVNSDWDVIDDWTSDETGYADIDIELVSGTRAGDFNGTYTVVSVSSSQIGLSSTSAVNPSWDYINELEDSSTPYISPTLSTSGDKWIGPFFLDVEDLNEVYTNFIALNGLYKDDGTQQVAFDITVELELTPTDISGTPTGSAELFQLTLEGSSKSRSTRASTLKVNPTFTGRCKARARRITNSDLSFQGTVVDEVKWEKMYSISPIDVTHFGNITTVYAQTYATSGALAVKERRLNMEVVRKIPLRVSGSTFGDTLTATNSADEILSFICLDPYLGNRTSDEIDFDSIYTAVQNIKDYFGDDQAADFSYTFDSTNISFEETVIGVAEAVFCNAYRQGNQIKLKSEMATEDSSLIFNHRNKLPKSEKRTVRFGIQNDYDGVELEYVSPDDGAKETFYIPQDRSAVNPRQVETLGIRTVKQAFWHAWRSWNKIQYQNILTEFEALEEAATTVIRERILVSDNTRPETQDGYVRSQSGLTLTLSQKVVFVEDVDYIIFLQHVDGTVESIPVTAGATGYEVVLSNAPAASIAVDDELYLKCSYIIVPDLDQETQAFVLTERDAKNSFRYDMGAVNYTFAYYQQDELQLWTPNFTAVYTDECPQEVTLTAQGGATIESDETRGYVHDGDAATDFVLLSDFNAPASYTKAAWVKKDTLDTAGHVLSSRDTTHEAFLIDASGDVSSGHSGAFNAVTYALPSAAVWHHVAVTYDAASTTMYLYVNGALVDSNTGVAQRTLANLTAFGYNGGSGFIGQVDDLRLYKRALSKHEIKEVYMKSRS